MSTAKLSLFVTGTDTEIGKTFVSAALLRGLAHAGLRAAAMKPIAAGAYERDGIWHNEDADQLDAAASVLLPPEMRTPFLLKETHWQPVDSHTAVQPLVIGSNDATLALQAALEREGLWVPAIRPPTVPAGTSRLRISLSAAHSDADLDRLNAALQRASGDAAENTR